LFPYELQEKNMQEIFPRFSTLDFVCTTLIFPNRQNFSGNTPSFGGGWGEAKKRGRSSRIALPGCILFFTIKQLGMLLLIDYQRTI
jgi:hypothetical protein